MVSYVFVVLCTFADRPQTHIPKHYIIKMHGKKKRRKYKHLVTLFMHGGSLSGQNTEETRLAVYNKTCDAGHHASTEPCQISIYIYKYHENGLHREGH